jgi:superfamily II DNA helicase RecQ
MASVVRHFGDLADGEKPCGICDHCAPAQCHAQRFRTATEAEHKALLRVAAELRAAGARSTGKLYSELFPRHEISRDGFEDLLGGMARAGIVRLDDAVFEKDGRQITYRTARLTRAGLEVDAQTPLDLVMKDREPPSSPRKRRKRGGSSGVGPSPTAVRPYSPIPGLPPSVDLWKEGVQPPRQYPARTRFPDGPQPVPRARPHPEVEEALRAWRLAEARRLGVPAFRIFTDRALSGLVKHRPNTTSEMLAVPGIGLRIAEKYGSEIRHILHANRRAGD